MKDKKPFTTTIDKDLIKEIKKLAIDLDTNVNTLIEEGIQYLLSKYDKSHVKPPKHP